MCHLRLSVLAVFLLALASFPGVARGGTSPLSEVESLVEMFSGRIAVLPAPDKEDLSETAVGRSLSSAGLTRHLAFLSGDELVDPKSFNAKRYPLTLYLAGEIYVQSVRRPGDADEALLSYLKEGGALFVLSSGPLPFCYNQDHKPAGAAAKYGLKITGGISVQAGKGLAFHLNPNQRLITALPSTFPFPAPAKADQRWRPIEDGKAEGARYVPIVTLRDQAGKSLGDGAAAIEYEKGAFPGARLLYVWCSVMADAKIREGMLRDILRYGLEGLTPPVGRMFCRRTMHPPKADGALDDVVWRDAPAGCLHGLGMKVCDSPLPTTFKTCWDDECLYVAISCKGGGGNVRLWLNPDTEGKGPVGIEVNSRGPVGGIAGAVPVRDARAAVQAHGADWTAEVAVPFAGLGTARPTPPRFGDELRMQLARVGGGEHQAAVWSVTDALSRTDRFGGLTFAPNPCSDDFKAYREPADGRPNWTILGGRWKVEQGAFVGEDCAGDGAQAVGACLGDDTWHDYTFSVRFRVESRGSDWRDGPWFGIHCSPDGNGYFLDFVDRACQVHKVSYGASTSDANCLASPAWQPDNEWHMLKVEARANRLRAKLDGRPFFDVKDDAILGMPSIRSGGIMLAARKWAKAKGKTTVRFDDVEVQLMDGGRKPPDLSAAAPASPADAEGERLLAELRETGDAAKALALAAGGDRALPCLAEGLEGGGRLAALCAWALCEHPNPGAAERLRALLWLPDQVAGYWAARALGRLPGKESVAALATLLPDERLGFWELNIGGLPRIAYRYIRGEPTNIPAPDWMPNLRAAYAAMESLGEIGGEEAASVLLKALRSDQYLIRYGATRGFGRMRYAPASPTLSNLARNDPVLIVRLGAEEAVRQIRGEPPPPALPAPSLPPAIVFIKAKDRNRSNLGFRDSYFYPKTPWYHWGEDLYTLTPPAPDGVVKNLTNLEDGAVQGPEVSYDGTKIVFAMRKHFQTEGFHIYEIGVDGSGLRQLTSGNCNDVDPYYLPDGRIAFCSDRAGYQEYYHQERSRVLYVMERDGSGIRQITFNPNQDYEPLVLRDGRVLYSSYRFYAQDGSPGPLRGEFLGIARIETVLRTILPDGSGDQLFYGSMRGSFYTPVRPMPGSLQASGWHPRGYHVGVSISQGREMPDGRIICVSPAGLTLVDPALGPVDCERPFYPEVVNLCGGEEVYIHRYDEQNPVGRFTTPYPLDNDWVFVSHAPWHKLGGAAYGIYLFNTHNRELRPVYDDPQVSAIDPIPVAPRPRPAALASPLSSKPPDVGRVYCNSVFNSDMPFDRGAVKYVRVIEAMQMGLSIAANAAWRTRMLRTAPLQADGSFYVEVPADTPFRFQLLDGDGRVLVHETEFNYARGGETKACIGCHEPKTATPPNRLPVALRLPPFEAVRQRGDLIYMGAPGRSYSFIYRE